MYKQADPRWKAIASLKGEPPADIVRSAEMVMSLLPPPQYASFVYMQVMLLDNLQAWTSTINTLGAQTKARALDEFATELVQTGLEALVKDLGSIIVTRKEVEFLVLSKFEVEVDKTLPEPHAKTILKVAEDLVEKIGIARTTVKELLVDTPMPTHISVKMLAISAKAICGAVEDLLAALVVLSTRVAENRGHTVPDQEIVGWTPR